MEKQILNILEKIEIRLGNLEEGQKNLEIGQRNLEGGQRNLEERQKNLEKDIKIIKEKLEATFERTGKNFEEIIKIKSQLESLEIIKKDITTIKQSLRNKLDLEEFQALENRVAIIERRLLKFTHN